MAIVISSTTNKDLEARDELKSKVVSALESIDADIATLEGSPTNSQIVAIIKRCLQRQSKIIRVVAKEIL